jgi:hypothetical protein
MDAFQITIISGQTTKDFFIDVLNVKTFKQYQGRITEQDCKDHKLFSIDNVEQLIQQCLEKKMYRINLEGDKLLAVAFKVVASSHDITFSDELTIKIQLIEQTNQDRIITKMRCDLMMQSERIEQLEAELAERYTHDSEDIIRDVVMAELHPEKFKEGHYYTSQGYEIEGPIDAVKAPVEIKSVPDSKFVEATAAKPIAIANATSAAESGGSVGAGSLCEPGSDKAAASASKK